MPAHHCDLTFSFHRRQRSAFRDGSLVNQWLNRYPMLFDEYDARVLRTEQQRRYHFLEWLSAILLFESTGYLSMVEKYTAKSHPTKRERLRAILPPPVFEWLCANESGQPDLFVYHPDSGDWFLCEVKGPMDRVRDNQLEWVQRFCSLPALKQLPSAKRTRVLHLHEVSS